MHPMTYSKILVVEDDPQMCNSIRDLLGLHGIDVKTRHHLADALDILEAVDFDLILLDLKLDDQCGFSVMDRLSEKDSDTRVIIITGCSSEDNAIEALKKGAIDYLKKPFEPDELLQSVNTVLDHQQHHRELSLFGNIIASSPEAILIGDRHGRILFSNPAYRRMVAPISPDREDRPAIRRHSDNDAAIFDPQIQSVLETGTPWSGQVDMIDSAGHRFVAWKRVDTLPDIGGRQTYGVAMMHQLATRPKENDLKEALDQVKDLCGMLSICASCKKIRNDDGSWTDIESFIESHTNVEFSHGICPDCIRDLYPELRQ